MKLDVNQLRYMEKVRWCRVWEPRGRALTTLWRVAAARPASPRLQDAWRTLVAVEMGMKNHEFVPAPLVDTIAGLRNGAAAAAQPSPRGAHAARPGRRRRVQADAWPA